MLAVYHHLNKENGNAAMQSVKILIKIARLVVVVVD